MTKACIKIQWGSHTAEISALLIHKQNSVNKKRNYSYIAPYSLEQIYFNRNDCTSSYQNYTDVMQT